MFGSAILDLAIGLIFTFLTVSLVTSVGTEALASALKWRANTLLDGVKALVNDPQFNGLALQLYNHAFVNSQSSGTATSKAGLSALPSYIDPKQFANALVDITQIGQGATVDAIQAQVTANVPNAQLRTLLNGMVQRAGGNVSRVRDEIANWFDGGMDRVAGAYKRQTQLVSFLIAIIVTVLLNIDAIAITEALWHQPLLIKALPTAPNGQTALDTLNQFKQLPLPYGWSKGFLVTDHWVTSIAGWIITAGATLFGAPFWFDTLQKVVQLRGAGSK
jgi:hypothetical protein